MIEQFKNVLDPRYNRAARFASYLIIVSVVAGSSVIAGETGPAIGIAGPARVIVADPAGGMFAGGADNATVVKIARDGATKGLRQFGPSGSSIVAMAVLPDGSLVLAGSNFVVKTSAALQAGVQAAVPFSVRAIAAGPEGSVYVAGDHAVRKLGSDLGLLWQADNVTTATDEIATITVDGANHIYIAGKGYVSALAEGGQPLSRVALNNCEASAMSVDASDNLYIAGKTPSLPLTLAPSYACVSKISFGGARSEWSAAVVGSGFSMATSIAIEPGGNVVIAGVTNSKYLPHASGTLAGRTRGFAARFDGNGVLLNTKYLGSGANSELDAVAVDNNGQAWVAGWSDAGQVQALVRPVQWTSHSSSTPAAAGPMLAEARNAGQPNSAVAGANAVCSPNLTVTSTADSGPGTLRDAVANACPGGIITFSLPNPSTIALTSESIHVLTPIAILGPGASALTIDGGSQSRIFYVSLSLSTYDGNPIQVFAIDGLTLANGLARGGDGAGGGGGALGAGGAIYLDIGAMSVTNVVFRNNRAVGGNGSLNDTGAAGGGGGGMGGDGAPGASGNANLGNGNGGAGGTGGDLGGSGGTGGSGATPGSPAPGGQGGPGGGGGGGAALLGVFAAGGPGGFGGGGGGAGVGNTTLIAVSGGTGGFGGGGGAGIPSLGGTYGGNGFGESPNSQGGGGGGAGLGGAIFSANPYQGAPILGNVTFTGNSTAGGAGVSNQYGASGAGQGKGGALWGQVLTLGALNFINNSASDAGTATGCGGTNAPVDTPDLCGDLLPTGQLQAVAGDAQSSTPNSAFAANLSVHVQITQAINASGLPVTFTAPAVAAGQPTGTFPGGRTSVTVLTDANGNATAPALTANAVAGNYSVTASYGPLSVPFVLANGVPVGATLTTATPVQNNGYVLTAVLQTAGGQPISGTVVHFVAPATGSSGSFVGGALTMDQTTDANGKATVTFVPNSVPGPILISASVGQLNATFNLVNQFNLMLVSVSPQPNNRTNISLKVTYPWGAAASGMPVSYSAPTSGPSGTTKNLTSDGSGNVNAEFDGNNIPGSYTVSFSIANNTGTVQVPITNIQYTISLIGVGPFSALLGQFFQNTMFVVVSGGPVSSLTFSTPNSPISPSGTFNGQFSASTVPDSSGSTTVPPLLANKVAGTWALRISLNPNLYQDFDELTNVQANITTQTTLSLDTAVGSVSDSYSYKVVVNSRSATGKATIYANGNALQSCTLGVQLLGTQTSSNTCGGSFKVANAGTYQLTASYTGDLNNSPSNSAAVNLTVFAATSSTTFTTVTVTTSQPTTTGSNNNCAGFATGGAVLFPLITCTGSNGSTSSTAAQRQLSTMESASMHTPWAQSAVQSLPTSYAIGNGPHTIATADFNGDGIPDWVVTNEPDGTVSVLLGNANGTLQSAVTYPAGTAPAAIVTGDFNHDGKQDWAVANSSGVISVALGLGNGTFTLPIAFQGTGSISQMAAADVNGDGFTDLVALDLNTGAINVYLNNGAGLMALVPNSQNPGSNPQAILVRDFNNDGKLDLAVAYAGASNSSTGQGTIAVLIGNGNGTFAAPKFLPGGQPISLGAAMYSGKGFLDLVVGYTGNNLVIYPGNGDGSFGSPISEPATNVTSILVGDFSGTGRSDIIALNGTTNVLHLVNQRPAGIDLTLRTSHTGMLIAGQTGASYSIVVTNAGQTASNGAVTVTDVAPAGLTIKRMTGTGWNCTGQNVCTRTDALGGGQSYPAITVTADLAASAPYLLANTTTVSGGGDTNALNNSSIDPGPVLMPQTITFAPITDQVQGTILNLNATATSGLPLAYTSQTPLVCTVSGNTATLANLGTCKIQASQPGDSVYAPAAPISRTFDVLASVQR